MPRIAMVQQDPRSFAHFLVDILVGSMRAAMTAKYILHSPLLPLRLFYASVIATTGITTVICAPVLPNSFDNVVLKRTRQSSDGNWTP